MKLAASFLVAGITLFLLVYLLSRCSPAGPIPAPNTARGQALYQARHDDQIDANVIVRSSVYLIATEASEDPIMRRWMADLAPGKTHTPDVDSIDALRTDLHTFESLGLAVRLSSPAVIVRSGMPATVTVRQDATTGALRTSETFSLEVLAHVRSTGTLSSRVRIAADQLSGELQHAMSDIGLKAGERAEFIAQAELDSGQSIAGLHLLDSSDRRGFALVLIADLARQAPISSVQEPDGGND